MQGQASLLTPCINHGCACGQAARSWLCMVIPVLTQQGLCIRQSVSAGVGCACRLAFKALAVDERVKLFAHGLDQSKQVQRAVVM